MVHAMLDSWREQGVNEKLLQAVRDFIKLHPWQGERPLAAPRYHFYGKAFIEAAVAALLAGENLLLTGPKATGKNVLAENLAAAFGRPEWNVSFHITMDASYMLGTDTFRNGAVEFRPGPVYECAQSGGFCVLDEINMARNEALAVLHSLLDFRRILDVPGHGRLRLHPAARFLATMNYGYAGTRELNEALASRFVVLQLPVLDEAGLDRLLCQEFPSLAVSSRRLFVQLFLELQQKASHAQISSRAVDLRGLIGAVRMMTFGLPVHQALAMGLVNKCFDEEERAMIKDVIAMRISERLMPADVFEK